MTTASTYRLLVVDDEPDLRTLYELTLVREGYDVESAGTVAEAWAALQQQRFAAVITDMRLPDGTGLDLLRRMDDAGRREKGIVITAYGSAENAVEALKAGAYDYLTKPFDLRQFRSVVATALGRAPAPVAEPGIASPRGPAASASGQAVASAPRQPGAATALRRLVGTSAPMQQMRSMIEKVARGMAPVLVQGESGTGKELVARAIHEVSPRAGQAFVAVNCGAIPEALLDAEFFGYRKGAFTGANEDRDGFFQAAHGGTLFLDEIGELPLSMQSKLLRVIQERAVRPLGSTAELPVNVRIISATHKDLANEVATSRFRQDLFYRLNVIQISVPPLRERLGFPGNVRELENLLHRALAMAGGARIEHQDLALPDAVLQDHEIEAGAEGVEVMALPAAAGLVPLPTNLETYLDEVERDILERALERHRYNRTAAGASLGLSLRQMRYRMARLGIGAADGAADRGDAG
ncbi:MAG: sigma-54-dependent Fis family transcriptional regulator [Rubrivivax sp.]|nr:sigma-54-dependent Fis family transcriptional regulator [Rubrivivax sp.]